MLDFAFHTFNLVIAICYLIIFLLIFRGLIKAQALGRNLLGTTTAGIFLTCSLGHFVHAFTQHVAMDTLGAIFQVLVDGLTVIPAITYVILRPRYGLIVRGPDMITEFQTLLDQREAEMKALVRLEKLKDEFLAIASHELKTPLTVIKGYSQLLMRRLKDWQDEKVIKAVRGIDEHVNRMTTLIGRLLDISRIQAGRLDLNLEIIDLAEVTRKVVERLQTISPNHALNLQVETGLLSVKADYFRLEQVIENLVLNAVKYSPRRDKVDIKCYRVGSKALLEIKDYGIGIPDNEIPLIFDRFYRSDNSQKEHFSGMGLGLYISCEIIKACQGSISVTSSPTEGSTFTVSLPIVETSISSQELLNDKQPSIVETHPNRSM